MVSSQLEAFLESMAGECDEKALRAIKANEIFYSVRMYMMFLMHTLYIGCTIRLTCDSVICCVSKMYECTF